MNIIAISNDLYNYTSLLKKEGFFYIKNKTDLVYENICKQQPDYIFFPHWSYIIEKEIFENFNCVIFHMTDLPFGRGGSPLQNLLERKIYKTKISAIKCSDGIDTGDIYLKRDLDISYGNAKEIYLRGAEIISDMINEIVNTNPAPLPQVGEVVTFKRRNASQSNIMPIEDLESVYNYIRMLDAPGYPRAFIKNNNLMYEFFNVNKEDNILKAQVEIRQVNNE